MRSLIFVIEVIKSIVQEGGGGDDGKLRWSNLKLKRKVSRNRKSNKVLSPPWEISILGGRVWIN